MSSPAYDGKGQPPVALGWFSGLGAWWNGLTPQYVTHASGGLKATPHSGVSSTMVTIGHPDAPAGAPGKPAASSGAHPVASGIRATPHSGVSSAVATIGHPDAPAGAPGKPAASSGTHPAASGAAPDTAPHAAKP